MSTVISFDQSRCRRASVLHPALNMLTPPADILMFTGVRRERLKPGRSPHEPVHPEPMFSDPAPAKPTGRSPRSRRKIS